MLPVFKKEVRWIIFGVERTVTLGTGGYSWPTDQGNRDLHNC